MSLLFVLLLSIMPERVEVRSIWDYHYRNLHQSLKTGDWYTAKQALSHLKNTDPALYEREGYVLTNAMIAREQEHWDTAWQLYREHLSGSPQLLLEACTALERMARYETLIEVADWKKVKAKGETRRALIAMTARAHDTLGNRKQAVDTWRLLSRRGNPAKYRMPAIQNLVRLYYASGERVRGRRLAEKVQKDQPVSDAALYSVTLQRRQEDEAYLERQDVWKRFANVFYRNRNFTDSAIFYNRILNEGRGSDEKARARYFLALMHLKRGDAGEGLKAFRKAMPRLKGTAYEGMAMFQYARTLYMNEKDEEVNDYVNSLTFNRKTAKWRNECAKLQVLALRRLNRFGEFENLGRRMRKSGVPNWLRHFYHRNGVVVSLENGQPYKALDHLERYRQSGLKPIERLEAKLWEGMILWRLDEHEQALEAWLHVAVRDPNHYFGLMTTALIRSASQRTTLWEREWGDALTRLEQSHPHRLVRLYHLAPDDRYRGILAGALKRRAAKKIPSSIYDDLPPGADAERLARIGRYDLAARVLKKRDTERLGYYYHKAGWFLEAGWLHDSISHAEILLQSYPRWMPYELLPQQIQKLSFPKGFSNIVHEKASTYEVDPYLLLAIIREESRFNADAKSWASARGLMQFIPSTAKSIAGEIDELEDFSLSMLYDPKTSITLGARYVDKLMETFDGKSLYTVAAYNAGESAVQRWAGISEDYDPLRFVWDVTYKETKYYCQKVLRAYHHYSRVYEKDSDRVFSEPDLNRYLQL